LITVNQQNRNRFWSSLKKAERHRNFADYFCCIHTFSANVLKHLSTLNIFKN